MFRKAQRTFVVIILIIVTLIPSTLGVHTIAEVAKKTEGSPHQPLLTQINSVANEGKEVAQPEKALKSAAVSFVVQAFLDDGLTKPLDTREQSARCKAGQPFYIKVTALDAKGNIEPNTFFKTPGKSNIQGTVVATDATTHQQYGAEDFPNVETNSMTDIAPGVAKARAVFNNSGKIRLAFSNSIGGAVVSDEIGTFIPDHFAIVSNDGTPGLTLRGNVDQYDLLTDEQWTWGYIEEPITLQFTVQALARNGHITGNYHGEVEPTVAGWGLGAIGGGGRDYTARLSFTGSSAFVHGTSEFKGSLSIKEDPVLRSQDLIEDLHITVNPHDPDGVSLSTPALAKVMGHNGLLPGPYRLYSRVINIVGGYFTERKVDLRVQLEIWDGHNFVVNTSDSQTRVELVEAPSSGNPPILTIAGNPVAFTEGRSNVSVMLNAVANLPSGSGKDYITYLATKTPHLRTTGALAWSRKLQ
ncbi:MAG: DUF6701 domain-containing protein [Desulfitobacteriaceae bacterium]